MPFSWWIWIAAAVAFGILETLAPVFVFLGLAAGAAAIGLLLALGAGFGDSLAWMLVTFAAISLVSTIVLRLLLGARRRETRRFEDDVNRT